MSEQFHLRTKTLLLSWPPLERPRFYLAPSLGCPANVPCPSALHRRGKEASRCSDPVPCMAQPAQPRRPGPTHPWAATRGTFAAPGRYRRASTHHHSGTPACARQTAGARQIRRVRREGGVDQQGAIHKPGDTHRRVEEPPYLLAGGSHCALRRGGGGKLAAPGAARRGRHLAGERPRGGLKECHFTVLQWALLQVAEVNRALKVNQTALVESRYQSLSVLRSIFKKSGRWIHLHRESPGSVGRGALS